MKAFLYIMHRILSLFLVWMLINMGPLNEARLTFSSIVVSVVQATETPNTRDQATLDRLSGCENIEAGKTEGVSGDKCSIEKTDISAQEDGWMISEHYLSTLTLWAVMFISMFEVRRCTKAGVSCGYSTLFSSIGSLALLAGEIASIVGFSGVLDKMEYRPDMLRKNADKCRASGGVATDEGTITTVNEDGTTETRNICDQLKGLEDQKKSLEAAVTAAWWKFALYIAGGVCYGIAAIIEYVAYDAELTLLAAQTAANAAAMAACNTKAAACVGPQAAACTASIAACNTALGAENATRAEVVVYLTSMFGGTPSLASCTKLRTEITAAQSAITAGCTAGICAVETAAVQELLTSWVTRFFCPVNTCCELACQAPVPVSPASGIMGDDAKFYAEYNSGGFLEPSKSYFKSAVVPKNFEYEIPAGLNSAILEKENELLFSGAKQSLDINDYNAYTSTYAEKTFDKPEVDLLENFLNAMTMPKALAEEEKSSFAVHAMWVKGFGLGLTGLGIILGLLGVFDEIGDTLYATPLKRALWNTLIFVMVGLLAVQIKFGVIDKLNENIAIIQAILDSKALAPGNIRNPGFSKIPYNNAQIDPSAQFGGPIIPATQPPLPCPAGGDGKGNCREIGNETDSLLQQLNLGGLSGLSGAIKDLGKSMGNSRDIKPSTMNAAGQLGASAAKIKKKLGDLKKKINKKREKFGKKALPFDKVQTAMMKKMLGTTRDFLKSKGTTAEALMAGVVGPGAVKPEDIKRHEGEVKAVGGAAPAPALNGLGDLNFENMDGEGSGPGLEASSESLAAKTLDDSFEVPNNDIGSDINADIFKMLSSRYLKSAYPVLFEEEKAPAKAP